MELNLIKLPIRKGNVALKIAPGHFATNHSHINYYIDVTMQKSRLSEAKAVAQALVSAYRTSTVVDTILCLDGTEVIAACLADDPSISSLPSTPPAVSCCCGTTSSPW